jgi:hypothetical protein
MRCSDDEEDDEESYLRITAPTRAAPEGATFIFFIAFAITT